MYRETDPEGTRQRVVVTVSRQTERIANGVTARVVHDVVTEDDEPVEVTEDWYAQDACGNLWYLGEDTREYENGKVSSRRVWEAGVDGAQPGVIMPAKPRPGMRYRQEHYAGHAEDRASILSRAEQVEVPYGFFGKGRIVMTRDVNPLEPKVLEFKFYARGVGPVLSVSVSGGSDRGDTRAIHAGQVSLDPAPLADAPTPAASARGVRFPTVRSWQLNEIDAPDGIRSPVVLDSEDSRAIMIRMAPGQAMGEHRSASAPGWSSSTARWKSMQATTRSAPARRLLEFEPTERRTVRAWTAHGSSWCSRRGPAQATTRRTDPRRPVASQPPVQVRGVDLVRHIGLVVLDLEARSLEQVAGPPREVDLHDPGRCGRVR